MDRPRAERAVREFLIAFGQDPDQHAELRDTPARVVDAHATELLAGYDVDVPELLGHGEAMEAGQVSGLICLRGISVSTICPHHLLLSHGTATLAYRPGARLFGLGTLAALVGAYSRRLNLQETIGESVVQALMEHGGVGAAYCELRLVHGCLVARGAKQASSELVTSARRGEFDALELSRVLASVTEPTL